jgi:hypothetical protein
VVIHTKIQQKNMMEQVGQQVGNLNTRRGELAGGGIQTAALAFGGGSNRNSATEQYDGTTWTTVANLCNCKKELAGEWNSTSALAVGGQNSPVSSSTQKNGQVQEQQ